MRRSMAARGDVDSWLVQLMISYGPRKAFVSLGGFALDLVGCFGGDGFLTFSNEV